MFGFSSYGGFSRLLLALLSPLIVLGSLASPLPAADIIAPPPREPEPPKVDLRQTQDRSFILTLENEVRLSGGGITLDYDIATLGQPRIARGPDFPKGGGSVWIEGIKDPCARQGRMLAVHWTFRSPNERILLPPGAHRILDISFDPPRGLDSTDCFSVGLSRCQGAVAYADTAVGQDDPLPLTIGKGGGDVCGGKIFLRGDANDDGSLNLADAVYSLVYLFLWGEAPGCMDAADSNDDGDIDISDVLYSLIFVVSGGAPPPPPYPSCGIDPTDDALGCENYTHCVGIPVDPVPVFTAQQEYYGIFNHLSLRSEMNLGCERQQPGEFPQECTGAYASTAGGVYTEIPWLKTKFFATEEDSVATITFSPIGARNGSGLDARSPIFVRAMVDGEVAEPEEVRIATSGYSDACPFTFVKDDLDPGLHTVQLYWRVEPDADVPDEDPVARLDGSSLAVRSGPVVGVNDIETEGDVTATTLAATAFTPAVNELVEFVPAIAIVPPGWGTRVSGPGGGPLQLGFRVPAAGATIAATFSVEAKVSYFAGLEVRALIDDQPEPFHLNDIFLAQQTSGKEDPDVVLSPVRGFATRSWTFTAVAGTYEDGALNPAIVTPGWHTLKFEWRWRAYEHPTWGLWNDDENDGWNEFHIEMARRSASVVVAPWSQGFSNLQVVTTNPASATATAPIGSDAWEPVPDLSKEIEVPDNAQVAVTFNGVLESTQRVDIGLLLDGEPVEDTRFGLGTLLGAASHTFVLKHLPEGSYEIGVEWMTSGNGSAATMGARNLVFAIEELPVPDLGEGPNVGRGAVQAEDDYSRQPIEPVYRTAQKILPIVVDARRPYIVEVEVADTAAGDYTVVFDAAPLPSFDGAGMTVNQIRDAIIDTVNDAGVDALAEATGPGELRVRVYDGDFGENKFDLEVDSPTDDVVVRVRHNAPQAIPELLNQRLFGNADSVKDYWRRVSDGRFLLTPAFVPGGSKNGVWHYETNRTGIEAIDFYWNGPLTCDPDDDDDIRFEDADQQRYYEVLQQAAADIPFVDFDSNRNGRLEHEEVVLIFITPQIGQQGSTYDSELEWVDCTGEPIFVDDVQIPRFIEWFAGNGDETADLVKLSKLIGHVPLRLDDMETEDVANHDAYRKSVMSVTAGDAWQHLDGPQKLALGWVTPRIVREAGEFVLEDVKTGREVLILPREGSLGREYFVIEHRLERAEDDGLYDFGISGGVENSGLAIWHVVEPSYPWVGDPTSPQCRMPFADGLTCLPMSSFQCSGAFNFESTAHNFIQRSWRLIRPEITVESDGSSALWNGSHGQVLDTDPVCPADDDSPVGRLRWSEGAGIGAGVASGYAITAICGDDDPDDAIDCTAEVGEFMRIEIEVPN